MIPDAFTMFILGMYLGNVPIPRGKVPQVLISVLAVLSAAYIVRYR